MHYAGREAHAGVDEARADVAALGGRPPRRDRLTGSGTEATIWRFAACSSGRRSGISWSVRSSTPPSWRRPSTFETTGRSRGRTCRSAATALSARSRSPPLCARTRTSSRSWPRTTCRGPSSRCMSSPRSRHRHGAPVPHRRRAGRRQGTARRDPHADRHAHPFGAQDPRTQGRGRAPSCAPASTCSRSSSAAVRSADCVPPPRNVPGAVGFGRAAHLARSEMGIETARRRAPTREALRRQSRRRSPTPTSSATAYRRLPGHLCLRLRRAGGRGSQAAAQAR